MAGKTSAENHALETLRGRLRKIMNDKADDIAVGGCKNFPEYTKATGVIEGLAIAERELLDTDDDLIAD